jgi:hypothetical protein
MKNHPPQPVHVAGMAKGEEKALHTKESGRGAGKDYRDARDATGINAKQRQPILPIMPHLPPQ